MTGLEQAVIVAALVRSETFEDRERSVALTLEASVHEATWSSAVVRSGRRRRPVHGPGWRHWPAPSQRRPGRRQPAAPPPVLPRNPRSLRHDPGRRRRRRRQPHRRRHHPGLPRHLPGDGQGPGAGPDHPRRQRRPRRHQARPGSRVGRRRGGRHDGSWAGPAAGGRHHLGRVQDPGCPRRAEQPARHVHQPGPLRVPDPRHDLPGQRPRSPPRRQREPPDAGLPEPLRRQQRVRGRHRRLRHLLRTRAPGRSSSRRTGSSATTAPRSSWPTRAPSLASGTC